MAIPDSLTERQRDLLAVLLHAELVSEAGDNPDHNRELCELRSALGLDPDRGREVIARREREHAEQHGLEIARPRVSYGCTCGMTAVDRPDVGSTMRCDHCGGVAVREARS